MPSWLIFSFGFLAGIFHDDLFQVLRWLWRNIK